MDISKYSTNNATVVTVEAEATKLYIDRTGLDVNCVVYTVVCRKRKVFPIIPYFGTIVWQTV
jgi:hypothetical protein